MRAKGGCMGQRWFGLCDYWKCYGQCRGQNEPGVVVIETERDLERLKEWAAVGKQYGMVQLIQLSHRSSVSKGPK